MLNILIVGAGAIGCFVGGHLAANGQNVTLLGRSRLMDKIAIDGLKLHHPTRPPQTAYPRTITSLDAVTNHFDFILFSIKSPDMPGVIEQLAASRLALENAYLVSLQNGIGNEETLAGTFGSKKVMAGTVTIPIEVPEAGVIAIRKDKGGLGLAGLHPDQPVQALADALTRAGLTTPTYPNYQAMKWSKLLLNIVNNATSAILDMSPAEIIADPRLFNLEIEALAEGVSVMKRMGLTAVSLPGYPVPWLARLVSAGWLPLLIKRAVLRPFMLSGRGTKMPSLHIDLAAGRDTSEVEVLNGAIVQAGQNLGVPTPVNGALTDILSGIVAGERSWDDFRQQPDSLLQAVAARRNG